MAFDFWRLLPPYWLQNTKTCAQWDKALSAALDRGPITQDGWAVAYVGGVKVWTANYPYAYGSLGMGSEMPLPKVATRRRLRKALQDIRRAAVEAKIAQAIEAGTAETGTGSVHESAVRQDAPKESQP